MTSSTYTGPVIVLGDKDTGSRVEMLATRAAECGVAIAETHAFEPNQASSNDDIGEVEAVDHGAVPSHSDPIQHLGAVSAGPRPRAASAPDQPGPAAAWPQCVGGSRAMAVPARWRNQRSGLGLAPRSPCRRRAGPSRHGCRSGCRRSPMRSSLELQDELRSRGAACRGAVVGCPAAVGDSVRPPPGAAVDQRGLAGSPAWLERFAGWLVHRCEMTRAQAAEFLNAFGHRTQSGRNWQRSTVSALVNARHDGRAVA